MASNLECIGLGVSSAAEFGSLVQQALAFGVALGGWSSAHADITFGVTDECTFNALAPEALLAELYSPPDG